jgi:N-acetylmuramic acid 6-phosphate etherase
MDRLEQLTTEARNPLSMDLDRLSALEIVQLMNREDGRVVPAVATQALKIAEAVETIVPRLQSGGRLIYVGAGTSGRLGVLDAAECPPTFRTPPDLIVGVIAGGPAAMIQAVEGAEDSADQGRNDLTALNVTAADVVVGIATSGRTPYVLGAIEHARSVGAFTMALTCNDDAELNNLVHLAIVPVVGPEIVSGSTRLKAGTATKLVLNTLTTASMVLMGKTYGNLMVDLRATNSKLRDRARRILTTLTDAMPAEAETLLATCDGEVKTALIVRQLGRTPAEARAMLAEAKGRVAEVLAKQSARLAEPPSVSGSRLVLGVDGGGTKTIALLAEMEGDRFRLLGRGESGPSNLQAIGIQRATDALLRCIESAYASAGLAPAPAAALVMGLAGADRPADQALLQGWARTHQLAERTAITNDAALLIAAGTPEGWGIGVIAGTGSIAVGRSPDGQWTRAGGWGYLLGDEGSAYEIALLGLRAVAQAADGRAHPTQLTARCLAHFQLSQPMDLIPAIYQGGLDRQQIAALAPVVLATADDGDAVALGILRKGAESLADAIAAVAQRLRLPKEGLPIALAGGVLLGSNAYRDLLEIKLRLRQIRATPLTLVKEPAEGAVRLAMELHRQPITAV